MKSLIILAGVAVLIAIIAGIVFIQNSEDAIDIFEDFSSPNVQQQGTFLTFTLAPNHNVDCRAQGILEAMFDNEWRIVQFAESSFVPDIQFSLVNRFTFEEVTEFRETINLKCDYDGIQITSFRLDSGFDFYTVGHNDSSLNQDPGNTLKSGLITFSPVNLPDNEWVQIGQYTFDISNLDEDSLDTQSDGEVWFIFINGLQFDFTGTIGGGQEQDNINEIPVTIKNSYKILVQPDQNVGDGNANNQNLAMEITNIVKTIDSTVLIDNSITLDTTPNQGRQITVTGKMTGWIEDEGVPTVTISSANTQPVIIFMQFDRLIGEDGQFIARYTLPQDSNEGIYTAKMDHFIRSTSSTANFTVENSGESDDDITQVDGTEPGTDSFSVDVCLNWKSTFKNAGEKAGLICDGIFDSQLQPLSFVNNLGGVETSSILNSLQVSPLVTFATDEELSKFSTNTSNLKYDVKLELLDQTLTLPQRSNTGFAQTSSVCITSTTNQGTSTECANTGLPLGTTIVSASSLEALIETLPGFENIPEDQFHDAKITISVSGDFSLRHEDGRVLNGLTQGANFVWETNYLKTSSGSTENIETQGDDDNNDGPCVGLPILEAIQCNLGGGGGEIPESGDDESGEDECGTATILSVEEFNNGFITQCNDGSITCKFLINGEIFTGFDSETCEVLSQGAPDPTDNNPDGDGGFGGGSGSGDTGIGGICSGTLSQCASALTDGLNSTAIDLTGFGLTDSIIILIILLIAIGVIAKLIQRRRR